MVVVGVSLLCGISGIQAQPEFASVEAKRSYALGMALGKRLRSEAIAVDRELYMQGLSDALSGTTTRLNDEELRTLMQDFQRELRYRQAAQRAEQWKKAQTVAQDAPVTGIQVSFKLDPRLTRGVYMGDRWVSPATYTGARQSGNEYVLEARADGLVDGNQKIKIRPQWVPSDPGMVKVTPTANGAVRISVAEAGESSLTVAANGVSKKLHIKASSEGDAMLVEITQ